MNMFHVNLSFVAIIAVNSLCTGPVMGEDVDANGKPHQTNNVSIELSHALANKLKKQNAAVSSGVNHISFPKVNRLKNPNAINSEPELPKQADDGTLEPPTNIIDSPNFSPYIEEVRNKIKSAWFPPRGQRSCRVVVEFRISKDGNVQFPRVEKSSGIVFVDQAAVNAVRTAAPFKKLPDDFPNPYVTSICFKLNGAR